ncbi:MAG TPA: DNA-directed RNA polymerase subunit omega [Firmicutes bacterium]|nr:DNA-directed RNA polymerase subunit omega [Bacillota bacterium]
MGLSNSKKPNRYTAIIAISKRARQIIDGVAPVVESSATKPVTIAIEELEAGKLRCRD